MTFIDIHDCSKFDKNELQNILEKDRELGSSRGVRLQRCYYNPTDNKMFCLIDGPSRDAVLDTHNLSGLGVEDIWEVQPFEEV
jgi:hypothetical protein